MKAWNEIGVVMRGWMKASRGCLGRIDLEILARAMLVAMAGLIKVQC
jgi:hypothetical protein